MMKRFTALLLALLMLVSLMPAAYAVDLQNPTTPHVHEHRWAEQEREEPTCTADGHILYKCSCGSSYKEKLPMLGHEMGEWVIVREATETQVGIRERCCVRSDKTDTEYFTVSGDVYNCYVGIVKTVTSIAADPDGYAAGETISYSVAVTNLSPLPITDVVVRDSTFGVTLGTADSLNSCETISFPFTHTATAQEASASSLSNTASVSYVDAAGNRGFSYAVCMALFRSDNPLFNISLKEVSSPKGSFYVEGEPVILEYTITVNADAGVEQVQEALDADYIGHMGAVDSCTNMISYYVTDADCAVGGVSFTDSATCLYKDTLLSAVSNTVQIECGVENDHMVSVTKQAVNAPSSEYFKEGDEVGYLITVTNHSETDEMTAVVYDNDIGVKFAPESIAPGASSGFYCSHVITKADVKNGSFTNTAGAQYLYDNGDSGVVSSNPVTVACREEEPVFYISKTVANQPSYQNSFFVEDETLYFIIRVENASDTTVKATVSDPMCWTSSKYETFAPNEVKYYSAEYTVTAADIPGSITNTASVSANGKTWYASATAQTGEGEFTPADVILVKSVSPSSAKSYPSGFGENDIVVFDIILYNTSDYGINEVVITDPRVTGAPLNVGYLEAGEFTSASIGYTVTKSDVDAHSIINTAFASFLDDGADYHSICSNTVVVPTSGGSILNGNDDPCRTTILGSGDNAHAYEQHYCGMHNPLREQAEEILSGVSKDSGLPAAYDQIRALWVDAVEELYALWFRAVDGEHLAAARADRAAFMQMLADYNASQQQWRREDAAYIAQGLARLAEDKCTELCYELYTVPEERPDSWQTENIPAISEAAAENCQCRTDEAGANYLQYTEINCEAHRRPLNVAITTIETVDDDVLRESSWVLSRQAAETLLARSYAETAAKAGNDETKQLILQDYFGFLDYIRCRENTLRTTFYPDNNKEVQEIICREILNRLAMNCEDIAEQASGSDLTLSILEKTLKLGVTSQTAPKKSSIGWIIGIAALAAIGAAAVVIVKKKKNKGA